MSEKCSICGQAGERTGKRELRPYGVGGALVCAGCVLGDSEREAEARRRLERLFIQADMHGVDLQLQAGSAPLPRIRNRSGS